jgi:hypothetical protein
MKVKKGKLEAFENYVKVNSDDFYSKAVVDYSIAWADMMEEQMSKGAKLMDIAEKTSHDADPKGRGGITGFQYGCAVGGLAEFWEHGEELRQWHNLDTQIGHEGEEANKKGTVLNPAILSIG